VSCSEAIDRAIENVGSLVTALCVRQHATFRPESPPPSWSAMGSYNVGLGRDRQVPGNRVCYMHMASLWIASHLPAEPSLPDSTIHRISTFRALIGATV
jgi:hypothetical protein